MADDKGKQGAGHRSRADKGQDYEVRHEAKKMGTSPDTVRQAADRAGPMRKDVERALAKGRGRET